MTSATTRPSRSFDLSRADRPVGLLGGGQLARMLAEAAARLGLRPIALAESAQDPAAQLCPGSVFGSASDPVTLHRFLSQVDHVAFENEFVSCDAIRAAASGLRAPPQFGPSVDAIFELQDKLRQKRALERLGIPAAPYIAFAGGDGVAKWLLETTAQFGGECVLKWSQQGYDGKGTFICTLDEARMGEALRFAEEAIRRGLPLFAEKKIAFRRELAIIGCHSVTGEFRAYPLVVSEQRQGVCLRVIGPATAVGVKAELEARAQECAHKLAEGMGLHGCFGIEFFETDSGELLVNEIAPRVHNTGHYTQDASATSQFENHWRAILGLPLGETRSREGFAMANLLGPTGATGAASRVALPEPGPRTHLHWYGKEVIRPGRKMGHLNGAVDSAAEIPELLQELEAAQRSWEQSNGGAGA